MSYIEDYLPLCEKFEGCVNHFYVDTVGKVTVGVGFLVPDVAAALSMPFQDDNGPASESTISSEFYRVSLMPKGYRPDFYKSHLTLPDDFIQLCLTNIVKSRDNDLRNALEGYDGLPDSWKMGLLDMSFNLGPSGLLTKFPHFIQDVKDRNWQGAQAQCRRPQLSMPRNDWTVSCFTEIPGPATP